MRIAYFGIDMFYPCLETLIKDGHEIICIFTQTYADEEYDAAQKVKTCAAAHHISVHTQPPTQDDIKTLSEQGCEMILSAGYKYKIPNWHDENIHYAVNIHPSLLPVGGGRMPLPLAITKGCKETGVTLHQISSDWDAGDILLQKRIPLSQSDILDSLLEQAQKDAVHLLRQFLKNPDEYWKNATPQNPDDIEYWPMPEAGHFAADFTKNVHEVEKFLRAHRFTHPNGDVEYIADVHFDITEHSEEPGTVLSEDNDTFSIAVADGILSFTVCLRPNT